MLRKYINPVFPEGLFVLALTAVRAAWFNFPLHPIGYLVACSYGSLVWAPFLLVWILKSLILRYGGSKLYLKALPGFLGFAVGHFVTAGLIWGLLAAAVGGIFLRGVRTLSEAVPYGY